MLEGVIQLAIQRQHLMWMPCPYLSISEVYSRERKGNYLNQLGNISILRPLHTGMKKLINLPAHSIQRDNI